VCAAQLHFGQDTDDGTTATIQKTMLLGFAVPQNHIVGKPVFIWLSIGPKWKRAK
jgi:hypothetical protein